MVVKYQYHSTGPLCRQMVTEQTKMATGHSFVQPTLLSTQPLTNLASDWGNHSFCHVHVHIPYMNQTEVPHITDNTTQCHVTPCWTPPLDHTSHRAGNTQICSANLSESIVNFVLPLLDFDLTLNKLIMRKVCRVDLLLSKKIHANRKLAPSVNRFTEYQHLLVYKSHICHTCYV